MPHHTRPLLLLDVDGPLSPYTAEPDGRPEGYRPYEVMPAFWRARHRGRPDGEVPPLRLWLDPSHGPALRALPFDLVWCTAWRGEADAWIGPLLGLPPLPSVDWPRMHQGDPDGLHWKTRHLTAWAAGRPFAWVDDEVEPQDTAWIAAHHPAPAMTLWVDHRFGLRAADFAALTAWAGSLTA
ncbi:hypothetical protein [Kitasatospora camelliae]|uniref:Secreted protein n=1 Tax=Kitasatospora camelliae TaxID=3156397 RepID=A0AAU8JZP4_9ACTN